MTDNKTPAELAGKDAKAKVEAPKESKLDAQVRTAEIAQVEADQKAAASVAGPQSKEQDAARESALKLDDLRAKAAEEKAIESSTQTPHTASEARVLAVVAPETLAGDHMAQNFGNDPENPKDAAGLKGDAKVRMSRVTPDVPNGPVIIEVHPDMVGDYARAGWNKD